VLWFSSAARCCSRWPTRTLSPQRSPCPTSKPFARAARVRPRDARAHPRGGRSRRALEHMPAVAAAYIEKVTQKTRNIKKFSVFVKMLCTSLARDQRSETVFADLLTYSDLTRCCSSRQTRRCDARGACEA